MSRFKLYIEYEGTRFRGWQIQKNARSVQGEISFAIKKIFYPDDFDFQGSGRTDAGVHALRQVAHLEVKTKLPPEIIRMKDFKSFTDDDPEEKSTKVKVEEIQIKESGDLILIRITGSHFIWKMVRRVVGVIAEVGRGKLTIGKVEEYIKTKSDEPAKLTAPPSGLFLEHVYYKDDKKIPELTPFIKI